MKDLKSGQLEEVASRLLDYTTNKTPCFEDRWVMGSAAAITQHSYTGDVGDDRDWLLAAMLGEARYDFRPLPKTLKIAEPWLAKYAPVKSWAWIVDSYPADVWQSMGGWFQAQADRKGLSLSPSPLKESNPALCRMLINDRAARSAMSGDFSLINQIRNRDPEDLPALETAGWLVACAARTPDKALDLAWDMLGIHSWEVLFHAIQLCSRIALDNGCREQLLKFVNTPNLIVDNAYWTLIAVKAGVLSGDPLRQILAKNLPRVTDELDPGRELRAGIPLCQASVMDGLDSMLWEHLKRWSMPPPLFAQIILENSVARVDRNGLSVEKVSALFEPPTQEWSSLYAYTYSWWLGAQEQHQGQEACMDVLRLATTGIAAKLPCQPSQLWIPHTHI